MTPYEILYLMNEFENTITNYWIAYASIVSGFLLTGYLFANKLSRSMVIILIALYTLFSFLSAISGVSKMVDLTSLAQLAQEIPAMKELPNLPMSDPRSPAIYKLAARIALFAYIITFFGSLLFFFENRKKRLKPVGTPHRSVDEEE